MEHSFVKKNLLYLIEIVNVCIATTMYFVNFAGFTNTKEFAAFTIAKTKLEEDKFYSY